MPAPLTATYNDKVFINCPFDNAYQPMMRAAVFAVYRCGFYPKSALEEDNGADNRLDKIFRMIRDCRYGIHDISRVTLDPATHLPRFNMPFELGLFLGARRFGDKDQKRKTVAIFDNEDYRYQQFISDLNGIDPKSHQNDPVVLTRKIRNWLSTESDRHDLPTSQTLIAAFQRFETDLPALLTASSLDLDTMTFGDLCRVIETYLAAI